MDNMDNFFSVSKTSSERTGAPRGEGERVGENEKLVARVSRLSTWHFRQCFHQFILDNPRGEGRPGGRP
jgi:hypothetical protein